MPAGPTIDTSRIRASRDVVWNRSLSSRSSSSRPTNGASSASDRRAPPRPATTRSARQAADGRPLALHLELTDRLEGDRPRGGPVGRVADEDGARLVRPTGAGRPC